MSYLMTDHISASNYVKCYYLAILLNKYTQIVIWINLYSLESLLFAKYPCMYARLLQICVITRDSEVDCY